jgi:hypothetical protein
LGSAKVRLGGLRVFFQGSRSLNGILRCSSNLARDWLPSRSPGGLGGLSGGHFGSVIHRRRERTLPSGRCNWQIRRSSRLHFWGSVTA